MNKKKLSTNLIRAGINRSKFMETSDPLFLTSGFIYESAEEAEKSFKEEKKRFMYSRFGNPTVEAFQKKMAILEEAEECWGTATGMAALFTIFMSYLKAGDIFGIIRFGSRVDIYFPSEASTKVLVGQKMIAGETIIADFTKSSKPVKRNIDEK